MAKLKFKNEEDVFWEIRNKAKDDPNPRARVITEMAARYEVPAFHISPHIHKTLYANLSKIMRLIEPKGARAAANLEREIQLGGLAFNDALQIARGNVKTREECVDYPHRAVAKPPLRFDLVPRFGAVIAKAIKSGYDTTEIASAFTKALADHTHRG